MAKVELNEKENKIVDLLTDEFVTRKMTELRHKLGKATRRKIRNDFSVNVVEPRKPDPVTFNAAPVEALARELEEVILQDTENSAGDFEAKIVANLHSKLESEASDWKEPNDPIKKKEEPAVKIQNDSSGKQSKSDSNIDKVLFSN